MGEGSGRGRRVFGDDLFGACWCGGRYTLLSVGAMLVLMVFGLLWRIGDVWVLRSRMIGYLCCFEC